MSDQSTLKFGIVTDCYGIGISLEEAITRLHKVGFRDLEVPGWHWTAGKEPSYMDEKHSSRLRDLRTLLNDLNMNVQQFHSYSSLAAESESVRSAQTERVKRYLDLAAEMGAKALVIHIGGRISQCADMEKSAIFDANAKSLMELAEHAENMPLKLAIENLMSDVYRTGCTIGELKDLIAEVNSSHMGICLDTGHANVDGLDVPEAIRECGSFLCATHIQETCRGNDLHVFPFSLRRGKSTMDWFKIFRAFAEIKYPYPLIGECANNSGELPLELVDRYLASQREILESVIQEMYQR